MLRWRLPQWEGIWRPPEAGSSAAPLARGADLKEDAALTFEGDFAIIQAPGGIHEAERADELFGIEALMDCRGRGLRNWRSSSHRWRIPLNQFNREAGEGEC